MSAITLKGNPINTSGTLPQVGSSAPQMNLVSNKLEDRTLGDYAGQKKILNIFPSVDTGTCATSVRSFNKAAAELSGCVVLNISADLPFAQSRFCGAEGIDKVETLSSFRSKFAQDWGLEILDGPLKGLCSRAIVVLDEDNKVLYNEQVAEIVDEPNYSAALEALK